MSDEREPVNAFGMEFPAPYEGFLATEAIIVLKGIDSDGDVALTVRGTAGLAEWDTIGMLTVALDMAKASSSEGWGSTEEQDD